MNDKTRLPDGRQPMTVLMNDTYFPVIDGVVRTVDSYARVMNTLGGAVVACPYQQQDFDDSRLSYPVIRTPKLRIPLLSYAVPSPFMGKAVKEIIALKPDIIHCHSPFLIRYGALKAAKKLGIPVVSTFHSKFYDDFLEFTHSHLLARLLTNYILHFYKKCDAVWACSDTTAETLKSYGFKGDVLGMPNGMNLTRPGDTEALLRETADKFGITPDRRTLLFVGNQFWKKNLRLILDAYRLYLDGDHVPCRLVSVGKGPDAEAIQAYAKELGFTDEEVRFVGQVSDARELSGIYMSADLFFFPSVYDNAPIVLREAALMGTPALVTEGSNSAEVIENNVNGFTAPEDASAMCGRLRELLADPDRLKAVGERAAETIPMRWEQIIPRVYEEYVKIIRKKKGLPEK